MTLPVALAACRPRRTLVPQRVQWVASQTRGCRCFGANPWLARVAGDPRLLQIGDGDTASHSDQLAVAPVPIPGLPVAVVTHAKQRVTSNGLRSFRMWKHARASLCASALIATTVGLRLLAFVEPFRLGAVAQREVGRFDEGPGEILVAVLGVALPLLLAVADALHYRRSAHRRQSCRRRQSGRSARFPAGWWSPAPGRCPARWSARPYSTRSPIAFCRRFSSRSICARSVVITATLALTARATSLRAAASDQPLRRSAVLT